MDDQETLKRIRKNDKKAFEEIFREYYPSLHEYALFYVGNTQLAEDIVQDVFLKIWNTRNRLTIQSSLKGYLIRAIHNHCIQYLRHQVVKQKYQVIHQAKMEEALIMNRLYFECGLSKLFKDDIVSLADKAIDTLPEKTREIFVLSRHRFLKNSEIAKKFNISEKSVEYHISRALDLLRKQLKDYLPVVLITLMMASL
ncbi:MAG: RNA polymerase sigma-70 factor [Bacteroidota bacterium]